MSVCLCICARFYMYAQRSNNIDKPSVSLYTLVFVWAPDAASNQST